jgi:RNA recognition motif-containing protein
VFIYFNLNKLMNYYYYLDEQQQQQYYPFIKVDTNMNVIVYVGELPPNVDQFELHKFIMTKGNFNVEAIYIRNNYNQSFAYVKFKTQNEAETAIKALHMQNFKDYIIKAEHFKFNRECNNDKTKTEGNVVIKNLPTDTTPKEVYDMFVQFGNVVSVNVRKDSNMGVIGFVSFDKEESAVNAVDKVNMRNYKGNALNVKLNGKQKDYNNNNNNEYGDRMLLVRNMPKDVEGDEWLKEVFGVYGNVVVCGVVDDEQQERMGVLVYGR